MKTTMLVCCIAAVVGLTACGTEGYSRRAAAPSPEPVETFEPEPELETPTPSPEPTETPSESPAPTATARPRPTETTQTFPTSRPVFGGPKPQVDFESLRGSDRVRKGDAGVHPDGVPDVVLRATIEGDVNDIIVTRCESEERPQNRHQWDTVTEGKLMPRPYQEQAGSGGTWVVGVSDSSGRLRNSSDGSLPNMHLSGPTRFELNFQNDGSVTSGSLLCVGVVRPGGRISVGSTTAS